MIKGRVHIITGNGEEFYMPLGLEYDHDEEEISFPSDFGINTMGDIDFSNIQYLSLWFDRSINDLIFNYDGPFDDPFDEVESDDLLKIDKLVIDKKIKGLISYDKNTVIGEVNIPSDSDLTRVDICNNNKVPLHFKGKSSLVELIECDYNTYIENFDYFVENGTIIRMTDPDEDEEPIAIDIEDDMGNDPLGKPSPFLMNKIIDRNGNIKNK